MKTFNLPIVAILLCVLVLLSGCAAASKWASNNEFQARLIVNQTITRYIEGGSDPLGRAERVQAVASRIRGQVDSGSVSSIRDLESRARAEIDWQSLSMADQELLDVAVSLAAEELMKRTGDGDVLSEDDQIRIRTLFQWIENAAGRFL